MFIVSHLPSNTSGHYSVIAFYPHSNSASLVRIPCLRFSAICEQEVIFDLLMYNITANTLLDGTQFVVRSDTLANILNNERYQRISKQINTYNNMFLLVDYQGICFLSHSCRKKKSGDKIVNQTMPDCIV